MIGSVLTRKARTALRQPLFVWTWLVPVSIMLGLARALILVVPFRNLAPRLGRLAEVTAKVPQIDPDCARRAQLVGRAIKIAAGLTPWSSNCFAQAIVARVMLGLYGVSHVIFFGLRADADGGAMQAHAWVQTGAVDVTGGVAAQGFTPVAVFMSIGRG